MTSRTHHATRTWRLSCGCLRDFPGMSLGKTHWVLCVTCSQAVTTMYVYPEHCCGFSASVRRPEDQKLVQVSCTQDEGNESCAGGVHYDAFVQMRFEAHGKLRSSIEGHTYRA